MSAERRSSRSARLGAVHAIRALLVACAFVLAPTAGSQPFPAKPIRLVVGVPAGSAADQAARVVADALGAELGGSVYVDNRPGGEGIIAVGQVTSAPADGYTLLFGLGSQIAINPVTHANLPYEPQRDLAPVSLVALQVLMLAVQTSLPVHSVADLVAYSRKHPGTVNYSAGTSTFMLAAESIKARTGADMQHIPFTGSAQALAALVGGTVQVSVLPAADAIASAQTGRIRILATSASKRMPALPDVPTFAEAGLADDVPVWTAVYAPAGTPEATVTVLNRALVRALGTPAGRERFAARGEVLVVSSPEELRTTASRDRAKMESLAKRLGLAPR
jgi:tripartite-type tricarboxylate transporter receptor subunit TctC